MPNINIIQLESKDTICEGILTVTEHLDWRELLSSYWKVFIYPMEMWDSYIFATTFDLIFENPWS